MDLDTKVAAMFHSFIQLPIYLGHLYEKLHSVLFMAKSGPFHFYKSWNGSLKKLHGRQQNISIKRENHVQNTSIKRQNHVLYFEHWKYVLGPLNFQIWLSIFNWNTKGLINMHSNSFSNMLFIIISLQTRWMSRWQWSKILKYSIISKEFQLHDVL